MSKLLLAVWLALPAWAEEPGAEAPKPAAEGEEEGFSDRELRRRERRARRHKRRELRRQLREQGRHQEADALGPDEHVEEETEARVETAAQASMQKAQKLGDLLKKSLNNTPEDMPAGQSLAAALTGTGLGGKSGTASTPELKVPAGGGGMKRLADPSNPKSVDDLLAAARSGYAGAFDSAGLKVGAGQDGKPTIVDQNGKPASPDALESLKQQIASEPEALQQRPDFFKVLPREKFQQLKSDIKKAELAQTFKHVATTPKDRDFVFSENCGGITGGCNPHVRQTSYRQGEYVAPEDLGTMYSAAHEEARMDAYSQTVTEKQQATPSVNAKGIRSKLNVVLAGIRAIFQDTTNKSGGAGGAPAGSVSSVIAGFFNWGEKPKVEFTEAPKREGMAVAAPGRQAPTVASPISTEWPGRPAGGLALGLAALGLFALAARRFGRS